jgi:hypothetical protein
MKDEEELCIATGRAMPGAIPAAQTSRAKAGLRRIASILRGRMK